MIKVTDFERVSAVTLKNGYIVCPKCKTRCFSTLMRYLEADFNCPSCGRGWTRVPDCTKTVSEAFQFDQEYWECNHLPTSIGGFVKPNN